MSGLLQAYAFAGIIGSGPWILSIVGILAIGLLSHAVVVPSFLVTQFQTSVTYLITISLVLTGACNSPSRASCRTASSSIAMTPWCPT